jgi:predicted amidohydrolase
MKLVLLQKDINNPDLHGMIAKAAELNPDILAAGELAYNGCIYQPRPLPPLDQFEQAVKGYPFDILAGVALTTNDRPFNSYVHYSGEVKHLYHKVNLFEPFNETTVYQPGKSAGIWETDFGRVGVAICYDLRFDNLFDEMKKAEVEMIFVPAAWPQVRNQVYRELSIKRARDCEAFVICINAVGQDEMNLFGGKSAVISPEGEVLVEADELTETILECEV